MTYSIATTGFRAESPSNAQPLIMDDLAAGRAGAQAASMANGTQFLCKGPDGAQRYYTIDASRSRPGGPVYLLAVGP